MKLSMATQILGFQHNVLLKKLKKKKERLNKAFRKQFQFPKRCFKFLCFSTLGVEKILKSEWL